MNLKCVSIKNIYILYNIIKLLYYYIIYKINQDNISSLKLY